MAILKAPKISKVTKLGQLMKPSNKVLSRSMMTFGIRNDRKKYKLRESQYTKKVNDLMSGDASYLVSGKLMNRIIKDETLNVSGSKRQRMYSITFKAKANLTDDELRSVVGNKLREYYLSARDGNSSNELVGFSMNAFEMPDNYKYRKNARLFNTNYIKSDLFNRLSEKIEITVNCVVDYLYHEFQKISKKVNKNTIIKQLSKFCNIEEGVTIEGFQKYMTKHHKTISYTILSPIFDCIHQYRWKTDTTYLNLTFYVNNSHLYPITNTAIQKNISTTLTKNNKANFFNYFQEKVFTKSLMYVYMEMYDPETEQNNTTYIMNKNIDINSFCADLITKHNSIPDYIDLNHKTGEIKEFKHPVKDIIYQSYDDYHSRKSICKYLNNKFNNKFIVFNNQSYAKIAITLLNYLDDIPKSNYREDTFDYLNEYEPKPIIDILKDCDKEEVLQVDYYKQYSSIFYVDFERYGIQIPVYDVAITIGEYFIEQIKYKNVKVFGCFVNYKIVEILLQKKYITKKNITHCINTKKYFTPSCFKEFVNITSELEESDFKKLNNILNGTLKNMFSRKQKSYFTTDINTLCYVYNDAVKNDYSINWNFDDSTNYHYIKTTHNTKILSNTSSFYRTTLSCSILQTLNLIKKCSKYGKIVKVLTDAVYYVPKNDIILEVPKKTEGLISNLGKYFYDFVTCDLEKHRTRDIIFDYKPIIKKDTYIYGAGGTGKTYGLIESLKNRKDDSILFSSNSNDSVFVLQEKIRTIIGYIPESWKIMTLSYFFTRYQDYKSTLNSYDLIVIDEIITIPTSHITKLEQTKTNKIVMGDKYQIPQIFNSFEQEYCMDSYLRKFYNCKEQKYTEGKSRYDKKTFEILEKFKNTGKTSILTMVADLNPNKIYKVNIASTNKIVRQINKRCCDHFHKKGTLFEFKDNSNKIGINCPVRCEVKENELFKEYSIPVGWQGTIKSITKEYIILSGVMLDSTQYAKKDIQITLNTFKNHFNVSYCLTGHKWQGQTIDGPYAIYETKREYKIPDEDGEWTLTRERRLCHRNMLYMACSRTGNYKNIHIDKDYKKLSKYLPLWEPSKQTVKMNGIKKDISIYSHYNTKDKTTTYNESDKPEDKTITVTLYEEVNITQKQYNNMITVLNFNINEQKPIERPIEIQTFKPLICQTNRHSIINVGSNRVICSYYNENTNKREKKELKQTNKRNLQETFEKIRNMFPNATINDPKMLLCF
jgi:hypothetical protein